MGRFHDVVAEHHGDSDAVLVADREPCITIAYDERENVTGRSFQIVAPDELDTLDLRATWIMAVLLCPGDDAEAVRAWVEEDDRDPRRVLFYLHTDTDAREALAPWHEAGLHVHSTWTVSSWKEFHKHFGAQWNVQVFDDFR